MPICTSLSITASADTPLSDVILGVLASHALLVLKRWQVDAVAQGATVSMTDVHNDIHSAHLRTLTEREPLSIELRLLDSAGTLLTSLQSRVEFLPRNQWAGSHNYGQLLAALVQPNDAAVEKLVKRVAQDLETAGQTHELCGYNTGATHVWAIARRAQRFRH